MFITMRFFSGKVFGGALLIAGSCIGAGMLGLPIVAGLLGFYPSLVLLFISWLFMTFTSLLLVEASGWFSKEVNLISMVEKSLGMPGKIMCWLLYLFLFYSILTAYIAASGSMGSSLFAIPFFGTLVSILFPLTLGIIVFFGIGPIDITNRFLMIGKICFYLGLLYLGLPKLQMANLFQNNFQFFLLPLPILVISFGFHNVIPSLVGYMDNDLKKTKQAILGGSVISLIVYLFWILMVIGIVPYNGKNGFLSAFHQDIEISSCLKNILGFSTITTLSYGFSACALVAAFLAQSLCLCHFLIDGFKIEKTKFNNLWTLFLTIFPPAFCALLYPKLFFTALNFAGGICAIILFGIFPILMAWKGRYVKNESTSYTVKGGKFALVGALIFSFIILINEIIRIIQRFF